MTSPQHLDSEADIILEAFAVVQARLDAGDDFERRYDGSITFARAVEDARLWRAFQPGRLFLEVVNRSNRVGASSEVGR